MLEHRSRQNVELLADRSIWAGMGGLLTATGLAQWSHMASLLAACCTIVFMGIRIYQVLKK
tara:strand:+ start:207 stop:389 length:183 start_codon:yes stop_codon:yes gene_type:complete